MGTLPERTAEGAARNDQRLRDRHLYRESLDDDPAGAWVDEPPFPRHILEDQLFTYVPGSALEALGSELARALNPSLQPDPADEDDMWAYSLLTAPNAWQRPCAFCGAAVKRPRQPKARPVCSDHCKTQAAREAARQRRSKAS